MFVCNPCVCIDLSSHEDLIQGIVINFCSLEKFIIATSAIATSATAQAATVWSESFSPLFWSANESKTLCHYITQQ